MARLKIISNPYYRKIEYLTYMEKQGEWIDVKIQNSDSKLRNEDASKAFLPFEIKNIIDIIIEEYYVSGEPVQVEFEGTMDEYLEVESVCNDDSVKGKIDLSRTERILENARLIFKPTKEIFEDVQPIIESIVKDDIKAIKKLNKVSDALKDIIPVCVFGNCSAGKSTFINALIGHEVLPSGGDPLTAKIYRIERARDEDIGRIRLKYNQEEFELLFEGNSLRTIKGNAENDLIKSIKVALAENNTVGLYSYVGTALDVINGYEKKHGGTVSISNIVELEIPFSKQGLLGQTLNNFVIFDTPGSNSSSHIEHSKVLEEALEVFSNGIPVWISTYESLDSTDNASLCDKILNIDALDKSFTMIALNKADGSDLEEFGFSQAKEREILEYESVEKMYASGIYFVSSIMGLGAKNGGQLTEKHYRKTYRAQQEMYSNPDDEDYVTLYRYNIMPPQIKQNVVRYSNECPNLIYANSGLYCIEREMENFAGKYAAYNKCRMVYSFLVDIRDKANCRIESKATTLKKTRDARKQEFESAKNELIEELEGRIERTEEEYCKSSSDDIKEFVDSELHYSYTEEELEERVTKFREDNDEKNEFEKTQKDFEDSVDNMFSHLKENGQGIFNRRFKDSIKNMADSLADDYHNIYEAWQTKNRKDREIDKQTSDELLSEVVAEYKRNIMISKGILDTMVRQQWQDNAEKLRNELVSIVTGSEALTQIEREELSDIIMNYEQVEFSDNAGRVFIKSRFLRGNVLGIRIGNSEQLNIKRLTTGYNDKIKETISELAARINESCFTSFKSWCEKLLVVLENNITEYNPQLRDMSELIKDDTDKIAELEDAQRKIAESIQAIADLMNWKELV